MYGVAFIIEEVALLLREDSHIRSTSDLFSWLTPRLGSLTGQVMSSCKVCLTYLTWFLVAMDANPTIPCFRHRVHAALRFLHLPCVSLKRCLNVIFSVIG